MGYRLLLIDDDQQVLKSIGDYFARVGHEVARAPDGKSGIAEYLRFHPDVVVLDLHLPDMSGLKVLEELRKRDAQVVMLTGEGQVDDAVEAMRLGAENFLKKPPEMKHLLATVEKAAEKGILRRENIELRAQLAPNVRRMVTRTVLFVGLVAAALYVGQLIGGDQERNAAPIPIPLPKSDTARAKRDSSFRPVLPPDAPPAGPPSTGRGRGGE